MTPNARSAWAAPVLLGALVGSLVAGHVGVAFACFAVAAALAGIIGAGWPAPAWWRLMGWGAGIAILLNLYLVDGTPLQLPVLFGRAPTLEGFQHGGLMALRLLGAVTAVHGLGAAWPGEQAADQLAGLLRPLERLRVPVSDARAVMGLAVRFAPLIGDEVRRIDRLQTLRGGAVRGPVGRFDRMRRVAVPALVGALERAERVALSLEARHYRARRVERAALAPVAALMGAGLAVAAFLVRG